MNLIQCRLWLHVHKLILLTTKKLQMYAYSGSQLSYVTLRVRSIIDLKTIGKKDMCVKMFGGAKQKKSMDLVQFPIKTENGHVPVNDLVSEIS